MDLEDTIDTYETVADEYERRHADREVVADLVDRFDAAVEGARILDVGCGPGWETATFVDRGYDVVGVDVTPAFLARAADRTPDAGLARADMRYLPLADGTINGLWACASFLHVPRADAPATLAEFARVLADGGALMLAVKEGDGTATGDTYDGDARQFTLYQAAELRDLVRAAGLTVEWSTAGGGWVRLLARSR